MAEEYNNNRVMGATKWWDSSTVVAAAATTTASSSLSTLQMMGLGPTSHPIHGHDIMTDAGFRSMYGEPLPALIKGFSLDQFSHTSSIDSCPTPLMPIDSGPAAAASGIFQVFMEPPPLQSSGYGYNNQGAGGGYGSCSDNLMGPNFNWNTTSSGKILHELVPQFFKASNLQQPHFFNNGHGGSFWNTAANSIDDPRPASFFPVDPPLAVPSFPDKHHHKNNMMAVKSTNTGAGRKSNLGWDRTSTTATASTASTGGGTTAKRARNEASSAMPPFKVRKEKMGDRITALQQLVSPFGKTDTASVLSESIQYIKFLHEQVNVLSTPYLKSGASLQLQQQNHNMLKDLKAPKKDLRSRGLCLVPVSSTFPVAHETTMDFWTPAFGSGTFR